MSDSVKESHTSKKFLILLWIGIIGIIIIMFVVDYVVMNQEQSPETEVKRVLQFELPDKTIFKLTLNGTDKGYYDLTKSSILFEGKRMMLTDLKFISDEYIVVEEDVSRK